jgi:hypothetical protein
VRSFFGADIMLGGIWNAKAAKEREKREGLSRLSWIFACFVFQTPLCPQLAPKSERTRKQGCVQKIRERVILSEAKNLIGK